MALVNKYAAGMGVVASIVCLFLHVVWSIISGCAVDFQRGGASIVAIAVTVFAFIQYYADIDAGIPYASGKGITPFSLRHPFVLPPILAVFGTLVWGYGDLLALNWTASACT